MDVIKKTLYLFAISNGEVKNLEEIERNKNQLVLDINELEQENLIEQNIKFNFKEKSIKIIEEVRNLDSLNLTLEGERFLEENLNLIKES